MMRKTRDASRLDCEREMEQLRHLHQERIKQEDLVKHFENSNETYIKIRKTVKEKVVSILSDAKPLLRIALLSLTESMRNDPDKYNALIFCDTLRIQTTGYSHYYDTVLYGQQQYPSHVYISMLLEEAEKLFTSLEKMLVNETIDEHASKTSAASSPMLPLDEEQQQRSSPSLNHS
jgi:predicted DNA-binding protein (UPF0251 family)